MENEQQIIVAINGDASGLDASVQGANQSLNSLGTNPGTKSLRAQLKEATQAAQLLLIAGKGNTAEYVEQIRIVSELRDAQELFNRTIPDAGNALQGVSKAAGIVSGSVSALSGVFKSAFPEATGTIDTLVQSLGGISAFIGSLDAFDDVGDIIGGYVTRLRAAATAQLALNTTTEVGVALQERSTVALLAQAAAAKVAAFSQEALNFVMNLNPIGLIITGIAALVLGFYTFKESIAKAITPLQVLADLGTTVLHFFTDMVGITSEAARASDAYTESVKKVNAELEYQNKILAAKGKNEREIYLNSRQILTNTISDLKTRKAANDEFTEKEFEDYRKANEDRNILDAKETKRIQDIYKERADKKAKADKAAADKEKAKNEAAAKTAKAKADADLKIIKTNLAAAQLAIDDSTKDEQAKSENDIRAKYSKQIALAEKYGQDVIALQDAQSADIETARKKIQADADAKAKEANDKALALKAAHFKALADAELLEADNSNVASDRDTPEQAAGKVFAVEAAKLNVLQSTYEEKKATLVGQNEELRILAAQHEADIIALNKDSSDKIKAIKQSEFDTKVNLQTAELEALGQFGNVLGQLAGKNKILQISSIVAEQGAAIGKILLNTHVANAKAVATSPLTGGQPWVTINSISGALGVASSLLAGRNAIAQINSGTASSGSGAGSIGSAPSVSANSAPIINSTALQPQTTQDVRVTDNTAGTQNVNVTARAYIVNTDLDTKAKEDAFTDSFSKV